MTYSMHRGGKNHPADCAEDVEPHELPRSDALQRETECTEKPAVCENRTRRVV